MDETRFTKYLKKEIKRPKSHDSNLVALDLFAGCGGLALGFEAQQFNTIGIESNHDASQTYNRNLRGTCYSDTLEIGYKYPIARPTVIIGGPPCQPFSVGGLQKGLKDSRDGFPIFIDAIRRLRPKLALFENVRGMLYRNKSYFSEIIAAIRSLDYIVEYTILNSVDFAVPQRRERLIVVAHRGRWEWPVPLTIPKFTAGEALGALAFEIPDDSKFLTKSMDKYVAKYEKKSHCINPRDLHLDRPARTVTCRNLHGATGDMHRILLPDGRRRRLRVREGARLQSFPDWFHFCGPEGSQFNQIGNAVPPLFSSFLAKSVKKTLNGTKLKLEDVRHANRTGQLELGFG